MFLPQGASGGSDAPASGMEFGMVWDGAKGKPTRIVNDLDLFQSLTSPYRAERAANLGGWAAGAMALTNLASGARLYFDQIQTRTWVSLSPTQAAVCCFAMSLAGLCLSVVILKRRPLWACILVLAWTITETQSWLTYHLYGHVGIPGLALLAAVFAIMGVRGSHALRKLAASPDQGIPELR
jgi:hypothetical protein